MPLFRLFLRDNASLNASLLCLWKMPTKDPRYMSGQFGESYPVKSTKKFSADLNRGFSWHRPKLILHSYVAGRPRPKVRPKTRTNNPLQKSYQLKHSPRWTNRQSDLNYPSRWTTSKPPSPSGHCLRIIIDSIQITTQCQPRVILQTVHITIFDLLDKPSDLQEELYPQNHPSSYFQSTHPAKTQKS